jgi:hypothetical protein
VENELFKLPDKQKTLNQINKKRVLDEKLAQIEKDINNYKIRLRDISSMK